MKRSEWNRSLVVFACGVLVGAMSLALLGKGDHSYRVARAQDKKPEPAVDLAQLQQDVQTLKDKAPSQSHSMMDVAYHYTNLWYAAQAGNWPLADFYWKETQSHMKWAVRIIPVRKDNAGKEVKLQDILQSIEQSPYMQVGKTIEEKDIDEFQTAYRYTMEGCYSCHKAADKPYLRPQIPESPAVSIVNFDPNATWPK